MLYASPYAQMHELFCMLIKFSHEISSQVAFTLLSSQQTVYSDQFSYSIASNNHIIDAIILLLHATVYPAPSLLAQFWVIIMHHY